jgi:transcriptional regulator with XRE-family HTH domain
MSTDSYGVLLRHYRVSRQLSQEELANASGLSIRAVRNAETDRVRAPHKSSVLRLADALQLSERERSEFAATALARRLGPIRSTSFGRAASVDGQAIPLRPGHDVVIILRLTTTAESDVLHIAAQPAGDAEQVDSAADSVSE